MQQKRQSEPGNILLTLTGAGRRIGISRFVAKRLLERGELKAVRVGNRLRVPSGAVDEYAQRIGLAAS